MSTCFLSQGLLLAQHKLLLPCLKHGAGGSGMSSVGAAILVSRLNQDLELVPILTGVVMLLFPFLHLLLSLWPEQLASIWSCCFLWEKFSK